MPLWWGRRGAGRLLIGCVRCVCVQVDLALAEVARLQEEGPSAEDCATLLELERRAHELSLQVSPPHTARTPGMAGDPRRAAGPSCTPRRVPTHLVMWPHRVLPRVHPGRLGGDPLPCVRAGEREPSGLRAARLPDPLLHR